MSVKRQRLSNFRETLLVACAYRARQPAGSYLKDFTSHGAIYIVGWILLEAPACGLRGRLEQEFLCLGQMLESVESQSFRSDY